MTVTPLTKAIGIRQDLIDLMERGRLVSFDSEAIVAALDQIKDLERIDRDEALELRAFAYHMTGDLDTALALLDLRQKDNPSHRFCLLANLSRCRAAQDLYSRFGAPTEGTFSYYTGLAPAIGAFHQASSFIVEAKRICLTNIDTVPAEEIMAASAMLTECGVSDEQVGEIMEVAGDVMTNHKVMFCGRGPNVDVLDIPGEIRLVHLTYRLPCTPEHAVDIAAEFCEQIDLRDMRIPSCLHVSFTGTVV